mmetsp:Transcript_30047/g.45977  ORF Transcript_30047/g.45977 Transcript_30047/m.45977 type:complete len:98 (-) Transcript_30047:202-495(-)
MDPAAPDAAKNICMKMTPIVVPVMVRVEKKVGNIVAPITVNIEIRGKDDIPVRQKAAVAIFPRATRHDAAAIDVDREGRVIPTPSTDISSGSIGVFN